MADIDLSGSSNLVALVYNEQSPPVDAKTLQERLKKEKEMKKEEEKTKRHREKEKEKEERKMNKINSPHNKKVTIEHHKYNAPEETEGVARGDEMNEDEEGEKDKTDCRCSFASLLCLILLFLLSLCISFLVSYKLTEQILDGGHQLIPTEDGIIRIGALFSSSEDNDEEEREEREGRLPRNIEPIWYNLTTRVNLPGFVELTPEKEKLVENTLLAKFRVVGDTQEIILHSAFIQIPENAEEWKILEDGKDLGLSPSPVTVSTVSINTTAETVSLTFSQMLQSGSQFYLKVSFSSSLSSSKNGFYISTYRTKEGKERMMGVTQCDPLYARRVLPCMDEPDRKAVFRVTMEHPRGSRALFNAIETGTENVNGSSSFLRTSFKETPPMSPRLLSFVVSDLKMKEKKTASGIPIRAFVQSNLIDHIDYALNSTVKMVEYYEKYFDIPYPLDKLDLVSVREFSFGAQENWGLMIFHENNILFHPQLSSPMTKKDVAQIIAHEVAHQWLGNLVSMSWWDDLWFNEALATHYEYTAIARGGVMEGMDDLFYGVSQEKGMSGDAFASSRPISIPVHNAQEIEQIYDSITYDKGAAVMRMVEDVVGEDNFRNGIRAYLKKFAYGKARNDDLIQSIRENLPKELSHIGTELRPFIRRYTKQNGFPVLNVERPDTMHVEITQEWFQRDSNSAALNKHGARYNHVWEVPLFYEVDEETRPITWMTNGLRLPSNQSDLLILNRDSRGYYRVNYDPRSWTRIIEELEKNHTLMSHLTRYRLIEDSFSLAEADRLPYEVALDILHYVPLENDEMPLIGAIRALDFIQKQIGDGENSDKVKGFIRRILTPIYKKFVNWDKLGLENEDIKRTELTLRLISQLWESGHKAVADKLHLIFENVFHNSCKGSKSISSECSKVPPLIRVFVYCEGIKRGRDQEFNALLSLYKNEIASKEKTRLLNALKCSRDTANLKKLYQSLLDKNGKGIFSGDTVDERILLEFGNHELSRKVYNEFFYENHEKLLKKYSSNFATGSLLAEALSASSPSELSDIESFLLSNPSLDEFDGFARAVERGRARLNWQRKHSKNLIEQLEKRTNIV